MEIVQTSRGELLAGLLTSSTAGVYAWLMPAVILCGGQWMVFILGALGLLIGIQGARTD